MTVGRVQTLQLTLLPVFPLKKQAFVTFRTAEITKLPLLWIICICTLFYGEAESVCVCVCPSQWCVG